MYVASSWRNEYQQSVVAALKDAGHDVYDFRNPTPGEHELSWREMDGWENWGAERIASVLRGTDGPISELAEANFQSNFQALERAEAVLCVMPCGRSAHAELGWAAGAGKRTAVLLLDDSEPELMWKVADDVLLSVASAVEWSGAVSAAGS